jgi:hypothetical protein
MTNRDVPPFASDHDGARARRGFEGNFNEPELVQWAEQSAISSTMDKLSGYGAVAFWILVAGLLAAKIVLFNPSDLRPANAFEQTPASSTLYSNAAIENTAKNASN